ncbi:glycosyltransferase family 2 protein [Vibrio sp. 1865]|uniref:glycosyltransferase family 2 protein n=1 Tax=unclassified Vibrio TaxID=2614977 RepID=UPI0029643D27|nr:MULTISPECIES: glycosyltransferase family 2 protein [unclassified Vibrio]MDW2092048.1 glycosyltransferase family 2 protein [Vibrio sp. 1866]MDW3102125.1 glycosyltransferase family 2 protein [Vibrio sp. 1874]MDW3199807.1 glycosyltransferase family 2 protein [Vibrio sp. 1865]
MKVYGIIVAYNPTQAEIEGAISRLENQCELIVVVNNSDNGALIDEVPNHKVINFGENLGIAKAQTVAMEWAFNNGADFVIQMDQDSILEENTVPRLVESYEKALDIGLKVGVIGPRHFDKVTNEVDEGRLIKGNSVDGTDFEVIHATISSASLIPKVAYEAAGGMEDGLFIDSVDWEYCWRLKQLGFLTIRVNNIMLAHRVGNGKKSIIGKLDVRVPSPIRHYYHTRNLFLLTKRQYVPLYWKVSNYIKLIFKLFSYPIIFQDGNVRFKYIVKGMWDGINGKYGRIDLASRKHKNV